MIRGFAEGAEEGKSHMARILIIDDDTLHLEMLQRVLERKAHEVTTATDGEQGLLLLREEGAFDLVLTDVFMPHVDGIDIMRTIRAAGLTVPVIAMTGGLNGIYSPFAGIMTALGARAVLAKPFSGDEVLGTIEGILARC